MSRTEDLKHNRIQVAVEAGKRYQEQVRAKAAAPVAFQIIENVPSAQDTPDRVAEYAARERMRTEKMGGVQIEERIIGPTVDFNLYPPTEAARLAGRPVARIVTLPAPGFEVQGFATGFLVGKGLLLTNHHVFPS